MSRQHSSLRKPSLRLRRPHLQQQTRVFLCSMTPSPEVWLKWQISWLKVSTSLSYALMLRVSLEPGGRGRGGGGISLFWCEISTVFVKQKEKKKPPSPTVVTGPVQPFPPEKRHDRKHESPLFLLFHSTSCFNILVYITFQPHPNVTFSWAIACGRPPYVGGRGSSPCFRCEHQWMLIT